MADFDRESTIKQYVGDMLALTKHIHEAVERQMEDDRVKSNSNAIPLLTKLDGILEAQIKGLETHLEQRGGSVGSPIKSAVGAVAGIFAGLYDKVRTETVSRMLRDDYTALSLACISQTMLHTTGLALKDDGTAQLALSQLKELTPIIAELSEVVPLVVVKELMDDSAITDLSAGETACKNTQEAWSSGNIHK